MNVSATRDPWPSRGDRSPTILEARGQSEEALRILTEEALPVFERLGDARWVSATKRKIDAILDGATHRRGERVASDDE